MRKGMFTVNLAVDIPFVYVKEAFEGEQVMHERILNIYKCAMCTPKTFKFGENIRSSQRRFTALQFSAMMKIQEKRFKENVKNQLFKMADS